MDRVRLVAMAANKLQDDHPEVAGKLRELLLEYWSRNESRIAVSPSESEDETRSRIEALLETALTFYESNAPVIGLRFWNEATRVWPDSLQWNPEKDSRKELYELLVLGSAVAITGDIPADLQPSHVKKQVSEWRRQQSPQLTYWHRELERALPGKKEQAVFKRTEYAEHQEFYRLVDAKDWHAAAIECRRLANRNGAWKSSYSDLGIASYRERGLVETFKWTSTIEDLEMRLAIELAAILEAKQSSATKDSPFRTNNPQFVLPLIVWPQPLC